MVKLVQELEITQRLATHTFVTFVCKLTKNECEKPHCRTCDLARENIRSTITCEKLESLNKV